MFLTCSKSIFVWIVEIVFMFKSVSLLPCPFWFSWATCVGCSFWRHYIKPCKVSIWTHCRKEAGSLVFVGTSVFIWAQRKWKGRTFAKWFSLLVLNMVQHLNITMSVILVSSLMPFIELEIFVITSYKQMNDWAKSYLQVGKTWLVELE